MSHILDEITAYKRDFVKSRKELFPVSLLEKSIYFDSKCISLKKYVNRTDKNGIIAEIKRKSPSKGLINPYFSVEKVSIGYMQAGASALSILTDQSFFGGKDEDLKTARKYNFCPILRKEFIIDEYQIIESKSIGADAILLIASILERSEMESFINVAHGLGLEVLTEVHNEEELEKCKDLNTDLIGVNNRDLKTFEVDINISKKLAEKIPSNITAVSESGISDPSSIIELRRFGYQGFLMGQTFMEQPRPEEACRKFIQSLEKKSERSLT